MIEIDGSIGEGGGQVLRSALTLSLLVQKPFRINNIRGRRKNPGLRAQHLASVHAAAAVGEAQVEGAVLGSQELTFQPSSIRSGEYRFDIGTAGSCSLVLQTIFLPLSRAGTESSVEITGGTHVAWSPTYDYIERVWLPVMGRLGYPAQIELQEAGFYPRGGGKIQIQVLNGEADGVLELEDRNASQPFEGVSLSANLPEHVAERQRRRMLERLAQHDLSATVDIFRLSSVGRGSAVFVSGMADPGFFGFSALGEKGKPAEEVADEAIEQLLCFLQSGAAVDRYLADQLLIPLAIAKGRSRFTVEKATQHLFTNADIIRKFLDVEIELIEGHDGASARVVLSPTQLPT